MFRFVSIHKNKAVKKQLKQIAHRCIPSHAPSIQPLTQLPQDEFQTLSQKTSKVHQEQRPLNLLCLKQPILSSSKIVYSSLRSFSYYIPTKYLNPKNDAVFKRIFGTEKNKDILKHFLNDVLTNFKKGLKICDIEFLKTSLDPELAARKTSIVDILCKDKEGHQFIVEMQIAKEKGFEKRAQYYAARVYGSQMLKADDYEELKEVIFIAVTDFVMFPDTMEKYKSEHIILDKESFAHRLKDFYFIFLELPKFNKKIGDLKTMIEKWMFFLKHGQDTLERDLLEISGENAIIKKAYKELERFSWTEEELRGYEAIEKHQRDYKATLAQQRLEGKEEGIAIGKEEGIAIGEERGIAIGEERGIAIGQRETSLLIARSLLSQGISLTTISTATGLSISELEKL